MKHFSDPFLKKLSFGIKACEAKISYSYNGGYGRALQALLSLL